MDLISSVSTASSALKGGTAVEIEYLRVDYGETTAVDDLSLKVMPGEIYGLVGPNGAGKTSTFKVLTTLLRPTYGRITIGGVDVLEQSERAHQLIGYMPDLAPVPSDLTCVEFLRLFGRCHGLRGKVLRSRVEECLELVQLADKGGEWCRNLSRGMMQRLVLAKTLLHRPEVMILDEPASGMDPRSRTALRHVLRALAQDGVAILVSSHILSELTEMCTHLGLLRKGKLLMSGTVAEVLEERGESRRLLFRVAAGGKENLLKFVEREVGLSWVGEHGLNQFEVVFTGDDGGQLALVKDLVAAGVPLMGLAERHQSLEELVLRLESQEVSEMSEKGGMSE